MLNRDANEMLATGTLMHSVTPPPRAPRGDRDLEYFAGALCAALTPMVEEVRRDLPTQLLRMFLLIAQYPGRSVKEYAEYAGVAQSVASRHILDLGQRNRRMEDGFDLVEARPAPRELRRHEVYLTHKGASLLRKMKLALERTHEPRYSSKGA
jgi:DNA-binding MarR family transcriptional regulator